MTVSFTAGEPGSPKGWMEAWYVPAVEVSVIVPVTCSPDDVVIS